MNGVERRCPVCGRRDAAVPYADANLDESRFNETSFASRKRPEYMHHRLERCARCALLFANPVPDYGVTIEEYERAGYDSGEEARYAARTYARLLREVVPAPTGGGALVDIGAGDGAFLTEALRAGYSTVVGFEPSKAPVNAAAPDIRPYLLCEPFREGALEAESFDVVTCFMTIEHVHQPLELCREARRLLRPGGSLLIVCHDWQAPLNRAMGRSSPIFDIEHFQLFSRAAARRLLENAGFVDTAARRFTNHYPLSYWMRLAPVPERAKDAALGALSATGAARVGLPMRVGNLLAHGRHVS